MVKLLSTKKKIDYIFMKSVIMIVFLGGNNGKQYHYKSMDDWWTKH